MRPDRLLIRGSGAALIDYKTGNPKAEDRRQLQQYAEALSDMGLALQQAVLVYITDHGVTPEFI